MGAKRKPKTRKPDLEAIERQSKALELRKAGLSFDEIAKQTGYHGKAAAYKAVHTALQRTLREPADELRTLEAERLDCLLAGIWKLATEGEPGALDRILRIMERRAKLLGLDIPPPKPEAVTAFDLSQLTEEAERAAAEYAPDERPTADRKASGKVPE